MQKDGYTEVDGRHGFSETQLEECKQSRTMADDRADLSDIYATAREIDKKSAFRQFQRWEKQGLTREQRQEEVKKVSLVKVCMDKGMSKHSVKKHIKEALARGDTFEDMAKALLSRGDRTLYPKQQRGSNT